VDAKAVRGSHRLALGPVYWQGYDRGKSMGDCTAWRKGRGLPTGAAGRAAARLVRGCRTANPNAPEPGKVSTGVSGKVHVKA
jgi:hypothetical protein